MKNRLLVLVLGMLACSWPTEGPIPTPTPGEVSVDVVMSTSIQGEIEPCG